MPQLQKYAFRFGHALHVAELTQEQTQYTRTYSARLSTILLAKARRTQLHSFRPFLSQ